MHADKTYNVLMKIHIIDRVGLMSMGLFSICYILFSSPFAELHIQPPFWDFPVFVGEILLFMCLLLFVVRCKLSPLKLDRWHYALIAYFSFVAVKGLLGYIGWGPMGLRDAALFYYFMFAVLGYYFYRKNFFAGNKLFVLVPFFIIVFIKVVSDSYLIYWSLSGVLLTAAFILAYSDKKNRYLLWALFFLAIPYTRIFLTSRMMLVSNAVTVFYLILALFSVLRFNRMAKFFAGILCVFLFVFGIRMFSDPVRARTIVSFDKIATTFHEYDKIIQPKISDFKMEEVKKLELYQPEGKFPDYDFKLKPPVAQVAHEQPESLALDQERPAPQQEQAAAVAVGTASVLTDRGIFSQPVQQRAEFIEPSQGNLASQQEQAVPVPGGQAPRSGTAVVPVKRNLRSQAVQEQAGVVELNQKSLGMVDQVLQPGPTSILTEQGGPSSQQEIMGSVAVEQQPAPRPYHFDTGMNNAVFRLLIWRDMLVELAHKKPLLGFHFGKPLRSVSLEILGWGWSNWGGQGWMPAHNSYLNIIYRAGIVGVLFLLTVFVVLFNMIREFIKSRSVIGILFCGVLINWFVAANFLLILELPYTAIPIWSLYGITLAYCYKKEASEYELAKQKSSGHRG